MYGIELLENLSLEVLIVAGVGIIIPLVFLAYVHWQLRRRDRRIKRLQDELDTLYAGVLGMGQRMTRIDRDSHGAGNGVLWDDGNNQFLQRTHKLVQSGAGIDELMRLCSLTRGEAELVLRMHSLERAV